MESGGIEAPDSFARAFYKVGIDIADSPPHQRVALNEKQHFCISGHSRPRQRLEKAQH